MRVIVFKLGQFWAMLVSTWSVKTIVLSRLLMYKLCKWRQWEMKGSKSMTPPQRGNGCSDRNFNERHEASMDPRKVFLMPSQHNWILSKWGKGYLNIVLTMGVISPKFPMMASERRWVKSIPSKALKLNATWRFVQEISRWWIFEWRIPTLRSAIGW